ncbi:mitochondrial hydrolase YKR070W [Aristolochia californica]|uniref:mitochondrial hydrolase YKR070W n=1 Tax=Aristolochia californica TaxID=171875 RepID=UPI0035E3874C
MRFLSVLRISLGRTRVRSAGFLIARALSNTTLQSERYPFGIAFDIDGVILRGRTPIGGSLAAVRKLYSDSGTLQIPFLFLTNGGGIPESRRAQELTRILGVNILPLQVVQGHSPFKNLLNKFENELIVAVGKGEPATVMSEYGFKKALSIDEYSSCFNDIDPLAQFKPWITKQPFLESNCPEVIQTKYNVLSDKVKAAFVVSDPVDWSRDIQVLCDILRSGGLPGKGVGHHQPDLYFAADDLEYQAAFPCERLGMGAFRIALESIYNRINDSPLKYTSYGKPNPFVFKNAEDILKQVQSYILGKGEGEGEIHQLETVYMVGDNPLVDIKGAQQTGKPWFSILTRTGVFKEKGNHAQFPADLVVDTVEEAVDYILMEESSKKA